jgi:hypothetical protein
MNTYPKFDTLDEADDHVQFACRGPVLCVVAGELWDVRGGGYAVPADENDVAAWKAAQPARALSPPASAGEGFVVVPKENLLAAAALLEGTGNAIDRSEAHALRQYAAAPTPPATAQEDGRDAVYGYCPICGAKGAARERRPNGDDICANKHKYPSRSAIKKAAMLTSPDSGKEG